MGGKRGPEGNGGCLKTQKVNFHLTLLFDVRYPYSQLYMTDGPILEVFYFTLSRGETSTFLPGLGRGRHLATGAGVGIQCLCLNQTFKRSFGVSPTFTRLLGGPGSTNS